MAGDRLLSGLSGFKYVNGCEKDGVDKRAAYLYARLPADWALLSKPNSGWWDIPTRSEVHDSVIRQA